MDAIGGMPQVGSELRDGERAGTHVLPLLPAWAGPSGAFGLPLATAACEAAAAPPDAVGDACGTPVASTQPVLGPERRTAEPARRRNPGQARWVGPAEPERPVMEILFICLEGGRRYYSVRLNGQEIFVGTRMECDRFLAIHNQKVALEQAEARRVPRARPFQVRSYRAVRA